MALCKQTQKNYDGSQISFTILGKFNNERHFSLLFELAMTNLVWLCLTFWILTILQYVKNILAILLGLYIIFCTSWQKENTITF